MSRILCRRCMDSSRFAVRSSERTEAEKSDRQAAIEPWNPVDVRAAPTGLHVQFAGFTRTAPLQPHRRFAPMLPGTPSRHPSSRRAPDARSLSLSREKLIQVFSFDCSRFKTPANPIKDSEAQAGQCSAQFPTQWQSSQRYALARGMYCIEISVIYLPRLSRNGYHGS